MVVLPPSRPMKKPKPISVSAPSDVRWRVQRTLCVFLETIFALSKATAHLEKSSMLDLKAPAPAFQAWASSGAGHTITAAVERARQSAPGVPIEVEVDTLEQLSEALAARPEMILLDNMSCSMLRQAVARGVNAPLASS